MSQSLSDERNSSTKSAARDLIDDIFFIDAQYQGNLISARNRDDMIDTWMVPLVERFVERLVKDALNV